MVPAKPIPNAFLALSLSDETRERLMQLSARLQQWQLAASWVERDDFHVTVLFLGTLSNAEIDTVPQAVDLVAGALVRPRLRLAGLGARGGQREPRVVYVALEDGRGGCRDLHDDLSAAIGEAPAKDFLPHITICRPRPAGGHDAIPGGRDWPQLLHAHGEADWGDCLVTGLVLYQRNLERGPRYRSVANWPLTQ
jgi:2'-5' RNA ligase